jgi:hypothetical protein
VRVMMTQVGESRFGSAAVVGVVAEQVLPSAGVADGFVQFGFGHAVARVEVVSHNCSPTRHVPTRPVPESRDACDAPSGRGG